MTRLVPATEPFPPDFKNPWYEHGKWPAFWVDAPGRSLAEPSVMLFRLCFSTDTAATIRVHVSADNRYRLFLDGTPVGRGPERGAPQFWRYESYELELAPGEHTLLAQTWWLGKEAPFAQMSVRPGFLLAAEEDWQAKLSTGVAAWECSPVHGVAVKQPDTLSSYIAGAKPIIDGNAFPPGWERGETGEWQPTETITVAATQNAKLDVNPYWVLTPATLPPMMEETRRLGVVRFLANHANPYPVSMPDHLSDEAAKWQAWLQGHGTISVPAHTTRVAILDLENYYCAYPNLEVSGGSGACIRLDWAESLFLGTEDLAKGNRDEVIDKYFRGAGEEFHPTGGAHRQFTSLWWEAGRYVQVTVVTADEPVTLEALTFTETRYPLEVESTFACSDPRLQSFMPQAVRTLQMCSHETYMDCPYYEQLMYVGDTRLEALITHTVTRDDRLPRKALSIFDSSRKVNGLTQSRYPSMVAQVIPPFSLWWVCMAHDYWCWRGEESFVRGLLPGLRAVMEYFRTVQGDDGLIAPPQGWNFVDWVPGWDWGCAPKDQEEPSCIVNLQCVQSLLAKADIEAYFGDGVMAERDRATAARIMQAVFANFWDEGRGLLADDLAKTSFSEHAQCLAILTDLVPKSYRPRMVSGLLADPDLARTTIYFSHYLFETYYKLGLAEKIIERLSLWFELPALGFKTLLESPEPSRSDSHAWASHPLYHYFASFLGIRPAAPGFASVRIAPQLGSLTWAKGAMPHPAGEIRVALTREGDALHGEVTLPDGVDGSFIWGGQEVKLVAGENTLRLESVAE